MSICPYVNVDFDSLHKSGFMPWSHWLAVSVVDIKKSDAAEFVVCTPAAPLPPPLPHFALAEGREYGGAALRPAPAQEVNASVSAHTCLRVDSARCTRLTWLARYCRE